MSGQPGCDAEGMLAAARGGGNPQFRIDRAGNWYYLDTPILRESMVRLFSSMLRRRGDVYVLQAPDQIIRVTVDDAPFVIVESISGEQDGEPCVVLLTNVGESFPLGDAYPLVMRPASEGGAARPYQLVRDRMPALVHRNVYYRLVEAAAEDPASGRCGVRSGGRFFALE